MHGCLPRAGRLVRRRYWKHGGWLLGFQPMQISVHRLPKHLQYIGDTPQVRTFVNPTQAGKAGEFGKGWNNISSLQVAKLNTGSKKILLRKERRIPQGRQLWSHQTPDKYRLTAHRSHRKDKSPQIQPNPTTHSLQFSRSQKEATPMLHFFPLFLHFQVLCIALLTVRSFHSIKNTLPFTLWHSFYTFFCFDHFVFSTTAVEYSNRILMVCLVFTCFSVVFSF